MSLTTTDGVIQEVIVEVEDGKKCRPHLTYLRSEFRIQQSKRNFWTKQNPMEILKRMTLLREKITKKHPEYPQNLWTNILIRWKPPQTSRLKPTHAFSKRDSHRGGSVMVWECFAKSFICRQVKSRHNEVNLKTLNRFLFSFVSFMPEDKDDV